MSRIMEDIPGWPIEKREEFLKEVYEKKMGRPLDLENPKSFSEMIQWIKLYYHDPVMSRCVDKILFKEFVREKIGGGIQLRYMKYGKKKGR